jgi:hypothetical protein
VIILGALNNVLLPHRGGFGLSYAAGGACQPGGGGERVRGSCGGAAAATAVFHGARRFRHFFLSPL